MGKASSRGSSGLGICAKRKAWVPKGTPKAEVCRVVAVASGQGCSEMLQCLQGSWAACVRNHATGWGGENWGRKKRSLGGAGNRVGIHAQLRGQSRPQCTGPQTLWGLQVSTQGIPGVPFPPLLHSPSSGHTAPSSTSSLPLTSPSHTLSLPPFKCPHMEILRSDAVRDMNRAETKWSSQHHTPYWFGDNGRLFSSVFPCKTPRSPTSGGALLLFNPCI